MKPHHKSHHIIAVIILSIVAGGCGYLAMYDTRLDDSQVRLSTAAMKAHDPSLYQHDRVFDDDGLWRGHSPVLLEAMKVVLSPAGYEDMTLPFRVISPVLTLVFLLGMYALIYRQCLNWSVSVFVVILSATVTNTPGHVSWGIGPVAMATPTGICLSVLPLLMIVFLRTWNYYKYPGRDGWVKFCLLLAVFAYVGLLGNIELGVSMNIAMVLVCVYLVGRKFTWRAWPVACLCLMVAAACAFPQFRYLMSLRDSMLVGQSPAPAPVVFDALGQGGRW
ncbi:MAG: hypothetical protein GY794_03380, partial [bacterium]|nr:hypothetical protein [bacterium]